MNQANLYRVEGEKVTVDFGNHLGQTRAWNSFARFPFVIAGTQSGKTSFGPWWLWREIENCGDGDYLAITANYDLFKLKMLPEMRSIFERLFGWEYAVSDRVFTNSKSVSRPGTPTKAGSRIILRSANAAGGLESSSGSAAWLDECGHPDFKIDAWEALQRRLSLSEGRALGTTTPYNMGWLKTEVFDRWKAGDKDFEVIQFKSTMNPAFPHEEYERMKSKLPAWKFKMFYDGEFEKPAGLIYDCFIDAMHTCPRFTIPDKWQRYMGIDFGGVNTAALFYAEEPGTGKMYLYRAYKSGSMTAAEHTRMLLRDEPMIPYAVGGAPSEGQWRDEFKAAGLPVRAPVIKDVEVGIDRVYEAHKKDQIIAFDDLTGYLEEKHTYARKLDASGEPTEVIENKETYHYMDAERYIIGFIKRKGSGMTSAQIDFYAPRRHTVKVVEPVRTAEEIDRLLESTNG